MVSAIRQDEWTTSVVSTKKKTCCVSSEAPCRNLWDVTQTTSLSWINATKASCGHKWVQRSDPKNSFFHNSVDLISPLECSAQTAQKRVLLGKNLRAPKAEPTMGASGPGYSDQRRGSVPWVPLHCQSKGCVLCVTWHQEQSLGTKHKSWWVGGNVNRIVKSHGDSVQNTESEELWGFSPEHRNRRARGIQCRTPKQKCQGDSVQNTETVEPKGFSAEHRNSRAKGIQPRTQKQKSQRDSARNTETEELWDSVQKMETCAAR